MDKPADIVKNTKETSERIKIKRSKIIALILLPFVLCGLWVVYQNYKVNEIYAVDPLVVTYDGEPPPAPIFNITNMLPGDVIEKTFSVKNDSPDTVAVEMVVAKKEEEKNFAGILDVEVTEFPGTVIYSGKLQGLFDQSQFDLNNFAQGAEKTYSVKVYFPHEADNEYQLAKVVFDIIWRTKLISTKLPPECAHLAGSITTIIEGTEGNDKIHGNVKGNLIFAKGGDDEIDASSGDDCIVLGNGDDYVESESGSDVVLGGSGNDIIETGSGNDIVYAGEGNDEIELGTGNDKAYGEAGDDEIDGGTDDDEIYGGAGNDTLFGGSGNDKLYGEGDNDSLHGESGHDYLDGGDGVDIINGNSGNDTCLFGESVDSCEA